MILAEDGKNDDILCRDGDCRLEGEWEGACQARRDVHGHDNTILKSWQDSSLQYR